jgi:N-acyl-D-amino-acid deacylase
MQCRLVFLLSSICCGALAQPYDVVISNGRIIDGTGNPWFRGDIAINDGKIVKIGNVTGDAKLTIDARGLIVSPGFVDVHTHIETHALTVPTAPNFIHDGVTTVVTGNCGFSKVDIGKYLDQLDSTKLSINVATLIGHNNIRREVMGESMRAANESEQKKMEQLVAQAMEQGAVGFSTGLIYVPGTYAKTDEVTRLAKVAASYNGVYASHIRNEGDNVMEAIDEALQVGREANLPVEISHFKVTSKPNWGMSKNTVARIERARQEGIDVTIDQYPYVASSTSLNSLVPSWVFSGGNDSMKYRIKDPSIREKIIDEMKKGLRKRKLKDFSYAMVANYPPDSMYNGKNISEVNRVRGKKATVKEEAGTILDMVLTGHVQMIYFTMDEGDLVRIMQYPFNMIASDAGISKSGSSRLHPRGYGTNARVLGHYVRERKVLTLEEAIRRMTSLPARKFQLRDRGILQEGMAADIVIFDEIEISDAATYINPHAYSRGFKWVIVNGQLTIENGLHTGTRNGHVLRRQK